MTDLRPGEYLSASRWESIASGANRSVGASAVRAVADMAQPIYGLAVNLRNAMFDRGWCKVHKLSRPVVSVGNLTAGGTGKTPMVIELCRRLQALGQRPAVLLRGYKGRGGDSDEAAVLRRELGSRVPVAVNADRVKGAQQVLKDTPAVTMFILDDGFQHRRVHRDVNLVLVNALCPFGYGHLLPRGLLREAPRALKRADAVIVTHADEVPPQRLGDLDSRVEQLSGRRPIGHTGHAWVAVRDREECEQPAETLRALTVIGVCGIGAPTSFLATLRRTAGKVISQHVFPDHHRYTSRELRTILSEASQAGAAVVLTEKDWVKWHPLLSAEALSLGRTAIYRPRLEMGWLDGAEATVKLLSQCLPNKTPAC